MNNNFRSLSTGNKLQYRDRYLKKIREKEKESNHDVSYYTNQYDNGECNTEGESTGASTAPNVQVGDGKGVGFDVRTLTPEISADYIYSRIKAKRSDAIITLDTIKHIESFSKSQGINHVFIVAASLHETGWWTSDVWKTKNNPAGIKGSGDYWYFDTPNIGFENMISNMTGLPPLEGRYYFKSGRYTIKDIGFKWAEDPLWPQKVVNSMKTFGLDVESKKSDTSSSNSSANSRMNSRAVQNEDSGGGLVSGSNSSSNSATYSWPTPGSNTITSKYGNRVHPTTGRWSFHTGLDIGTPKNRDDDVVASRDGEVIFAGVNGGYGNMVKIRHSDGYITYYAHNKTLFVKNGDKVVQGQRIAHEGTTGVSTGDHLHFEVRSNATTHHDPAKFISPDNTIIADNPPTSSTNDCVPAPSGAGGVDEKAVRDYSNITSSSKAIKASGKSMYIPFNEDVGSNSYINSYYEGKYYDLVPTINIAKNINTMNKTGFVPDNIPLGRTPRKSYALTMMNYIQSIKGDLSKSGLFKEIPISHKSIKRLENDDENPYRTHLRIDLIRALELSHEKAKKRGLVNSRFVLVSGYRTLSENANLYKENQDSYAAYSPHLGGYGVDILMPNRSSAVQLAKFLFNTMNFGDVGVGDNFVHVDMGPRNNSIRYYD